MATPRLHYFVAAALLGHGLALWFAAWLGPLAMPAVNEREQIAEVTLQVELQAELPAEQVADGDDPRAEQEPPTETAARGGARASHGNAQPPRDPIATVTVPDVQPSGASLGVARAGAPSTTNDDHPSPAPRESERGSKTLSLDQLGIGTPSLFALDDGVKIAPPTAEDRLAKSLAQATLDADIDKGLGPATLVTTTLKQVAMGEAPPRSKARLRVFANSQGAVTRIEVEGTNHGFDAWRAVASKALAALKAKRLRHGLGRPLSLLVEVESKVQLPSGRSPGTNVTAFGVPAQESGHTDSTKLEVLSPKVDIEMVEVLDPAQTGGATVAVPVPVVKFTILGIDGDLVDIGAQGRQVIQTRVLEQTVL